MNSLAPLVPRRYSLAFVAALLVLSCYAVFGSGAQDIQVEAFINIDLGQAGSADVQVIGASGDDHMTGSGPPSSFDDATRARSLATGDFNADGIQDVIIGAADADVVVGIGPPRVDAGAVYVIFGRNTPFLPVFDTATDNPNIRVSGSASGDRFGFAVATGDINGDNFDDLLIGAPGADFPGVPNTPRPNAIPDTGAVYVLLGSASQTNRTVDLAAANSADIIVYGVAEGDTFGTSLAVGNAGGLASTPGGEQAIRDFIVGAPANRGPDPADPRPDGGAVYLIFGKPSLARISGATQIIDIGNPGTPANVIIYGKAGDQIGAAVTMGDINLSAPLELIVGAPGSDRPELPTTIPAADNTGATFIFAGGANLNPATGPSKVFDINSSDVTQRPTTVVYGADADDHSGAALAAGDVTGEGSADLIVGAPDGDGPVTSVRIDAGEVYLLGGTDQFNPPTGQPERRIDLLQPGAFVDLVVIGAAADNHFGSTVGAGSFNVAANADSIRDLIIGAPGFQSNKGSVSILFGGPNLTLLGTRDVGLGQDDLRIIGEKGGSELGWALATADIDNNRGGDLIVGAPYIDVTTTSETRANAGKAYILLAADDVVPPPNQTPTVQVTSPNGGETATGGSTFKITWSASDPNGDETIQRFEVRLSTDGGASFNTIINETVPGSARETNWSVPRINTTTARIRVTVFDSGGLQALDDSNADFTISDPGVPVRLLAPNGAENLKHGQTFQLRWEVPPQADAQVRGFDLYLSTDSGANFNLAIQADPLQPKLPAGARTYDWAAPSSICSRTLRVLVQATSVIGSRSTDASDGDFALTGPGPTIDLSDMRINSSRVELRTTQPAVGDEIRFQAGIRLQLSADSAGTQLFEFNKLKIKKSGKRLLSKGSINGQDPLTFFPDGATRLMIATNQPCGVTFLRVTRRGEQLVPQTASLVRTRARP